MQSRISLGFVFLVKEKNVVINLSHTVILPYENHLKARLFIISTCCATKTPWIDSAQPLVNVLHTPTASKHNIQQHRRTKQQKEIGKHQQFRCLEGNISPAAFHPINQPNWKSQHEPNRETLFPSPSALIFPSGAPSNSSALRTTRQIFFW